MAETFDEQFSRFDLMCAGYPTWDLSENDIAALCAVRERNATLEQVARECRDALKGWQDHLAESLNCMDAKEQAIFFRGRAALAAAETVLEESNG